MLNRNDLLFSAGAIIRALKGKIKGAVLRREEWWRILFVIIALPNGRKLCTFISKRALARLFVEDRKARARAIVVTQSAFNADSFTCRNESKGTTNEVIRWKDRGLTKWLCTCEDFNNQEKFIIGRQQKACKHLYAVLGYCGYESLAQAIGQEEEKPKIAAPLPEFQRVGHGSWKAHWSEILKEDLGRLKPIPSYY